MVSQKCQYALRAIFELAKHYGQGPVKISDVAEAQAIPPRFLEVILSQLKQGGFVESRRGPGGGYLLVREPRHLVVGQVLRFVEGPLGPIVCVADSSVEPCPIHDRCALLPMWEKVHEAMAAVYDGTTFQDLLDEEARMRTEYVPTYAI